jgi:hypothetical protein
MAVDRETCKKSESSKKEFNNFSKIFYETAAVQSEGDN